MVSIMADIVGITRIEAAEGGVAVHPARRPVPLGPGLLAIGLAVVLMGLGVPRLVAAVLAVPGQETATGVRGDDRPSAEVLAESALALERAHGWVGEGGYDLDRGLVLLRASELAATDGEADRWRAASRDATARGLAASPVRAGGWLRLAFLRRQGGDDPGAARALRLSLLTGPVVPEVTGYRLRMAMALWPHLDRDTRHLVQRQIRLAWVIAPTSLSTLPGDEATTARLGEALSTLSEDDMEHFLRARRLVP